MTEFAPLDPTRIHDDVRRALAEDIGVGDATAELLPADSHATARLTCREDAVLAGAAWFEASFRQLDPQVRIHWHVQDGQPMQAGQIVCELTGQSRALVSAERTALNFLQLLSGTATKAATYAAALSGTTTRVLDTRKTVPGLRLAQKYAVRCGGGYNQRIGLFDAILVKENHIAAAGGIAQAVAAARRLYPHLPLEVEVETLDELEQTLAEGVDRILLDNFELAGMREAVRINAGRAELEVSGNVELDGLQAIAATGVDFVSVGALTKHVQAIDFSLRLTID